MSCIDFHSHVLPNVDDGSQSVTESLKLLQTEADQGIRKIVATPHFYASHDTPERFLQRRERAMEQLREAMAETPGLPEIIPGAEVYYFPGMSESEALRELTIGGSDCLLLEMPLAPWTPAMYREMEAMYVKGGITPVIAHIDRYIHPFRTYGIPKMLEQLPVLVQANAEFFLNRYTGRMALRMLREDRIHLLGSDCHNLVDRRPNLGHALQKIEKHLGEDPLRRIREYENHILLGSRQKGNPQE